MTSQPTPATPSTCSTAAALHLAVAAVAGFGLVVLVYIEQFTPLVPSRPASSLLAAVLAVAGFGYISRAAEDRIGRRESAGGAVVLERLAELDRRVDELSEQVATFGEQRYQAGHDDGFVDGAAGPLPQVPSLNGRRPRPVTHG